MLDKIVDSLAEYVSREDTKRVIDERIVGPCLEYIQGRMTWIIRMFHAMVLLTVIQTLLLVYLLVSFAFKK